MYGKFQDFLKAEIQSIKDAGLYKTERLIATPQDAEIKLTTGETVLNFCANNYLGLSSHPRVIEGAKKALDARGYGMSSVRFICGTQDIHKELEAKISKFFGTEDTILYAACFDANGGVFEPLFGQEDAIISDELNHASIIDGVRLCKAVRYRYKHANMEDLEEQLKIDGGFRRQKRRLLRNDGALRRDLDGHDLTRHSGCKGDHALTAFGGVVVLEHRLAGKRTAEHLAQSAAFGLHLHVGRHPCHCPFLAQNGLFRVGGHNDHRIGLSLNLILHNNILLVLAYSRLREHGFVCLGGVAFIPAIPLRRCVPLRRGAFPHCRNCPVPLSRSHRQFPARRPF